MMKPCGPVGPQGKASEHSSWSGTSRSPSCSSAATMPVDACHRRRSQFEQLAPALLQLFGGALSGQVLKFGGILGEVEDLFGLVFEVVDVLLLALEARQARARVPAAEHKGAVLAHRPDQRASPVRATPDLVVQQVGYGREDVQLVHRAFERSAALDIFGVVDEQRYPQPLLVDHVVVLEATVLAEALAVVADDDEDRRSEE